MDAMEFNCYPNITFYTVACDYVLNIPGYGAELGRSNYLGVSGVMGRSNNPNDSWGALFWNLLLQSRKWALPNPHHRASPMEPLPPGFR